MPIISLRPDVEDIIEFVEDDTPAVADSLVLGDPVETPSLAEQRAQRRKLRSVSSDVRRGAA